MSEKFLEYTSEMREKIHRLMQTIGAGLLWRAILEKCYNDVITILG